MMWLARSLLLVWCVALLAAPVYAGSAEDPELSDDEGDVAYGLLSDGSEAPYLDITAMWITPSINTLITLSLQTVDNAGLSTPPSDRHISCSMTVLFQNGDEEASTLTATYRAGGANDGVESTATWRPPRGPNGGGSSVATVEHNFSIELASPGLAEFQFDAPTFVGWGDNITYVGATCNQDLYAVLAHNTEHTRDRDLAEAEVKIPTSEYRYVKEPSKPRPSETTGSGTDTDTDAGGGGTGSEPAASDGPTNDVDTEESPLAVMPFVVAFGAVLFAARMRPRRL